MLKIFNIKDKPEYIKEVAELTQKEWGSKCKSEDEYKNKIIKKINKIIDSFNNKYYCKLILLDSNKLLGFISIFEHDCDERKNLYPWYPTMNVDESYRGKGYSRVLNDAILKEARAKGITKIYLKTTLNNYYEKFGAKFLEVLENGEKIYYFELE